jgi:hypothetical protein
MVTWVFAKETLGIELNTGESNFLVFLLQEEDRWLLTHHLLIGLTGDPVFGSTTERDCLLVVEQTTSRTVSFIIFLRAKIKTKLLIH